MSEQMSFGFEDKDLREFLTSMTTIEDEQDRLREQQRELVEQYKEVLPMRWVRVALKVVRARRKLEAHSSEPLMRREQNYLEEQVEKVLEELEREGTASGAVPQMF